jgi:hypothetical protein
VLGVVCLLHEAGRVTHDHTIAALLATDHVEGECRLFVTQFVQQTAGILEIALVGIALVGRHGTAP